MTNLHCRMKPPAAAQRGATLLLALIFMVIFTLLGLSVVGTTGSEERMARNFRDRDLAFEAAEAALRDAEIRITGYYQSPAAPVNPWAFNANCDNGLCDSTVTQPADTTYVAKAVALGTTIPTATAVGLALAAPTGSPVMVGAPTQPKYLIEAICRSNPGDSAATGNCQTVYRISAWGYGSMATTQVKLQEMFLP
jgi:type IV pilus assembly protein PilX